MATSSDANREHWHQQAAKIARRVNLGWWLDQLSAPLVVTAAVGSCTLLLARKRFPDISLWWFALTVIGSVLLIAGISWLLARRKFETPTQSLVRIEATLRLRNALSAAEAGVAPWPAPQFVANAGTQWNWPRLLVPTLGTLLLLTAGLFIPLSATEQPAAHEEPLAWKKIEADLNKLAEDKVVDETYLEEMQKRIDEMRAQKEEDWFSHSSLEATDAMKKAHQAEISRMNRELGQVGKALGDLQKNAAAGNQAEQARLATEFDQALQGLKTGAMKPNPDLLKQLENMDPNNLGQLSPEQLQQLKDNLQKARDAMGGMQGQNGQGDEWSDQLLGDGNGGREGEGSGEDGEGPGQGGVSRGPGHDPNVLGKEHEKRTTGDLTPLEAKDLSRATPGDLLQIQDGEHEINQTPSQVGAGGNTQFGGAGGDRVWKESLDPSEQRAMKNFFSDGK
jgi:hypothetical protein